MKNFEDFLLSADIDNAIKVADKASQNCENIVSASASANTAFTIELLRQYHEWLMKQLA